MTPQEIAKDVAAYYREDPTMNWIQGSFGSRVSGCCLFGAIRRGFDATDVAAFCNAFEKQTGRPGTTLVYFNDHIAKNVDDVLVMLDKVARS